MQTHRVPRANNVDLIFDGELLADVSSYEEGQSRWTELRIYRTDSGRYVTERIGRTTNPGEYDRIFVNVYDDPARIREGFQRPRPGQPDVWYVNDLAIECMELAAERDPAVRSTLVEYLP